jgi:hypothetical protein
VISFAEIRNPSDLDRATAKRRGVFGIVLSVLPDSGYRLTLYP